MSDQDHHPEEKTNCRCSGHVAVSDSNFFESCPFKESLMIRRRPLNQLMGSTVQTRGVVQMMQGNNWPCNI
ncbi:hypothetical protein TNCV_49881 [Trichonephila clavipes]|nr:hypothetical protein TNCV_49881 [Trichonephila clavipes]